MDPRPSRLEHQYVSCYCHLSLDALDPPEYSGGLRRAHCLHERRLAHRKSQEPHPTLGIYARCIRNPGVQQVQRETLCGPYAESFGEIASGFWQATAIFLAVGIFILCTVALVSVFTMCVQSIMKKSIFNVCGLLQGIAGLFLILGLILYPAGWGCQKAVGYCGPYASAYKPGDCSLGWAFYTAIGGTVLTFICAVFSAQAEIATSSDKVQEEIEEGKNLICLL